VRRSESDRMGERREIREGCGGVAIFFYLNASPFAHGNNRMLRSILSRGSSLIPPSSSLRPSSLASTSSLLTRHYATPHPTTQPKAASSPAEQHHQHDKATSHGGHDSHAVDSHGNEHHSEHHHGDHGDHGHHHHINHDNGPYGILFGEVCEAEEYESCVITLEIHNHDLYIYVSL
jgi:hypothetical protein